MTRYVKQVKGAAHGVVDLLRSAPVCPPYWATAVYTAPVQSPAERASFMGIAIPVTLHEDAACPSISQVGTEVVELVRVRSIRSLLLCSCSDGENGAPPAIRSYAGFLADAAGKVSQLELAVTQATNAFTATAEGEHLLVEQLANVIYQVSGHPTLDAWHDIAGVSFVRDHVNSTAKWATATGMSPRDAGRLAWWMAGRATALEQQVDTLVTGWKGAVAATWTRGSVDDVVLVAAPRSMDFGRQSAAFVAVATADVLAMGESFALVSMSSRLASRAGLDAVPAPDVVLAATTGGAAGGPVAELMLSLVESGQSLRAAVRATAAAVS